MDTSIKNDGRLKSFTYLTVEKAALYRAVMRLFMDAKARFAIHLRPSEIVDELASVESFVGFYQDNIEDDLQQLCNWGNLRKTPDTAEVATVEEFYRPRYLYQLTAEGEAAQWAVAEYEKVIKEPGELQTAALRVIREGLEELATLAKYEQVDAAKIHVVFTTLRTYFDQLTSKAQIFIGSLQRAIDLHGVDLDLFLAYKDTLIDYLERFIGELVVATADIVDVIVRIECFDVERLLRAATNHDLSDA